MTRRRAVIASFAVVPLVLPRVARAQPARKVYRIGILNSWATSDLVGPQPRSTTLDALLRGLHELGYVYAEHFVIEGRGHEARRERYAGLAAELLGLRLDVIVSSGHALAELKQATSTIPIVMADSGDPVGEGLVQSLARPGGNITGLSLQLVETTGKRLELLKDLVPGAAAVAVLREPANAGISTSWQAAEAAARARGWKLLSLDIRDAGEIENAFRAATDARAGALLVTASALLFPHRQRVVEQAAKSRLPAMYPHRQFVEAGGLISYSTDVNDLWRRAAAYVDKILKGAKPADLPVQQPTRFELVINSRTAKALGLTIPQSLLLRADEVIR